MPRAEVETEGGQCHGGCYPGQNHSRPGRMRARGGGWSNLDDWLWLVGLDRANEAVSAAGEGFDIAWLVGGIAESLTEFVDGGV